MDRAAAGRTGRFPVDGRGGTGGTKGQLTHAQSLHSKRSSQATEKARFAAG